MPKKSSPTVSRLLLGAFFTAAGAGHFLKSSYYINAMPPGIPMPLLMVYVSGFFEILFGNLVLYPRTRKFAGWGMIALLIAVFPANIHMALNPGVFDEFPSWLLWVRLPLQAVFLWWVWKAAISDGKKESL